MTKSAKRQYCSDNCRVAAHRSKQHQRIAQQEQLVQEQSQQISDLKKLPDTRTEVVRETNPEWLAAKQAYDSQQAYCFELKNELATLEQKSTELAQNNKIALWGAGLAVAGVLIWMAQRYDNRKQKPLGVTFIATSIIYILVFGTIGYYMGRLAQQKFISSDQDITNQLAAIAEKRKTLLKNLEIEKGKLENLRAATVAILQVISETSVLSVTHH